MFSDWIILCRWSLRHPAISNDWGEDMYEYNDYERYVLEMIAHVVKETVQENENVDDIMFGNLLLGTRRASLRNREFQVYEDVPFGLALFCWWPFKPQYSPANRDFLLQQRWALFDGLSQLQLRELNQNQLAEIRLMRAVPDKILELDREEMFRVLQDVPLRRILNL